MSDSDDNSDKPPVKKKKFVPDRDVYVLFRNKKRMYFKLTKKHLDEYNKRRNCSAKTRNNWLEINKEGKIFHLKPTNYDRTLPGKVLHGMYYFIPLKYT